MMFTPVKQMRNVDHVPFVDMDVALIRWPEGETKRARLGRQGRPRLLLVDRLADAPVSSDVLEDWVRLPVTDSDVRARVTGLQRRMQELGSTSPSLDGAGAVHYLSHRVELSELQANLIAPLIDSFETVVSRQTLTEAGWGADQARRNTLDVHMVRLRRRLEPTGLEIRTVRSRGYLLMPSSDSANAP